MIKNKKTQIELLIVFVLLALIITSVSFVLHVVNKKMKSSDIACQELGFDNYFALYGKEYCIKNGTLTEVIKSCGRGKCLVALK